MIEALLFSLVSLVGKGDPVFVSCSYANLRGEPSSSGERVSQVLFGDALETLGEENGFYQVGVPSQHGYQGWISSALATAMPNVSDAERETVVVQRTATVVLSNSETLCVYPGSMFTVNETGPEVKIMTPRGIASVARDDVASLETLRNRSEAEIRRAVVATARQFIGVPYLWGGTTPQGFDCSGLVYLVFRINGILIERDAIPQWTETEHDSETDILPGDLVFFETYKPGPSHVGIAAGGGEFIQAASSRGVSVSSLNDAYYRLHFYGAGRVGEVSR